MSAQSVGNRRHAARHGGGEMGWMLVGSTLAWTAFAWTALAWSAMTGVLLVVALAAALLLGGAAVGYRRRVAGNWRARQEFARRREWLEADFFREAAGAGKPRGLRWVDCRFDDPVTFAVDPRSGRLNAALVGVTIQFEAIEGGGMEDVEAVSNLRMATAVFRHDGQQWFSQGRAVFNLSPVETVQHLHQELKLA